MNIYLRELKANRKSIIIWSLSMVLFVIMGMQKYSAIAGENTNGMIELINSMPKFLQSMWGISSLDITTPIGYFGVLFSYLALMAAIHSSMLGSNIIYKEERDKTAEFLMTKPISRNKIILSKFLISLTNIIIFNLVTFITSYLVLKTYSDTFILKDILLLSAGMFFIQVIFLAIGIYFSCIMKRPKKSSLISMGILITTYFFYILSDISNKISFLKFITPFKYFDAKDFLINKNLNIYYIILTIIIATILMLISYKKYKTRDLNL